MNTFPVLLGALCVYALAYRYYSAFIAAKALALDDRRTTPGHVLEDGHNYVPSPKWVLFGHHFAAIAGAGPLVGPTLAAQFGFAPGFLWLLIGAVLAGCVQDFTVLVASVRHGGRSLADIARTEISPFAGLVAMVAVLFILLVTLAGLGIVVVNALAASPWGVFTIGMTIPIALIMGMWMFKTGGGKIKVTGPSIFGVVFLIGAVIAGNWFAHTSAAGALTFNAHQITILMAIYGLWLRYHYAIMFEALFILTTIDTGTRVARYVLQELMGKVHKPFGNSAWLPGNLATTFVVVLGWGYLIYTGNISTIWPLFGTGNQLLATIALAVTTTFLINMGKANYAWLTAVPMCFVGVTTVTAGVLGIKNIFWPLTSKPGQVFTGYLDSILMAIFIVGVVLVVFDAVRRWIQVLRGAPAPQEAFGPPLTPAGDVRMGCC